MSNAVAVIQNTISNIMSQEVLFTEALLKNTVNWKQEMQFAIQHVQKGSTAQKPSYLCATAASNPTSMQNAIINVAAVGISLNPASKFAYLVPRKNEVCLDISYMGLMYLAKKSGAIKTVEAKLVYAADNYQNNGTGEKPTHTSNTFAKDKGEVVGAYCISSNDNIYWYVEEMDRAALDKVKNASSSGDKGPWKTWPEEMMRKTVVKRASKYWQCAEVDRAVSVLNEHEGIELEITDPVTNFQSYTKEQQEYYHKALKDNNAIGVFIILQSVTEDQRIGLCNDWPHGQKGKMGDLSLSLKRQGEEAMDSYAIAFDQACGDEDGSMQLIEEIKSIDMGAKRFFDLVLGQCSSEVEMYFRNLFEKNK